MDDFPVVPILRDAALEGLQEPRQEPRQPRRRWPALGQLRRPQVVGQEQATPARNGKEAMAFLRASLTWEARDGAEDLLEDRRWEPGSRRGR